MNSCCDLSLFWGTQSPCLDPYRWPHSWGTQFPCLDPYRWLHSWGTQSPCLDPYRWPHSWGTQSPCLDPYRWLHSLGAQFPCLDPYRWLHSWLFQATSLLLGISLALARPIFPPSLQADQGSFLASSRCPSTCPTCLWTTSPGQCEAPSPPKNDRKYQDTRDGR